MAARRDARGRDLTTIDCEPEHQRAAKEAFRTAEITPSRTRLINGRALDVLPRLADGAYDLVFVDAAPMEHPHYVRKGVRLLRAGGAFILTTRCSAGAFPIRTSVTRRRVAVRAAAKAIAENDRAHHAFLIPIGDGLLCASRC